MPTTTNYGWTTPADTDLVKDGASAIRTLGSSIDTTTKALNPETTLGDISYRSSTANTNTRLAIGTTGQVLTVAGGVPSWATPAAAGGMTEISSGTLSTGTVTISSIPSTYKDLVLSIFAMDPSNDGAQLEARFNNDAGSNYQFSAIVTGSLSSATTQFEMGSNQDNGTSTAYYRLYIPNYANTTTWKSAISDGWNNDTTNPSTVALYKRHSIWYKSTSAISSITLQISAGTFSGGTFILYGVS